MTSKKRFFDILIVLALLWVAVLSQSAYAAALQVNSFIDNTTPGNGQCSLREAINNANSDSDTTDGDCLAGTGADSIFLPAGTYLLTLAGTPDDDENANAAGDLDISGDLTINGVTSSVSIVDGNHSDRVFHILSGSVTFNNLAVQNGTSADGAQGANCNSNSCLEEGENGAPGGGIYNQGSLSLFRVSVIGNQTGVGGDAGNVNCPLDETDCETIGGDGGQGGGIYNAGSLSISQSRLTNNLTGNGGQAGSETCGFNEFAVCGSSAGSRGNGGGIAGAGSGGNILIIGSTLSGNTAHNAGAILQNAAALLISNSSFEANTAGTGGALICNSNSQSCNISGSTFSGNYATGGGGGAIFFSNNGSKSLSNSTISGNTSLEGGGGIQAFSAGVGLYFVTIANNTTIAGDGGGLGTTIANVQIRNSILANNIDQGGQSPDCNGELNSGGYNLIGNPTGCLFTPAPGDLSNIDPKLGPLAFNGGPTQTHALRFNSPALDAGDGTGYEADQRGVPRPFNHPDASPGEVADQPAGIVPDADIGAVEMRAILVTNADNSGAGSLRQALLDANGNGLGHDDILFEESFFSTPRTINLASALGVIQTSLNLIGPGANKLDVHRQTGGEYRIFQSSGAVLDMVFSGLTISNGFAADSFGGGMYISNDLVLAEVEVTGSQTTGSNAGGGVFLGNGSGTFINSTFSNNTASSGGGVAFFGNIGETLRLVNCTFSGNNGGAAGGGVRHVSNGAYSTLEVINTTFANNVAASGSAVSTEAFSPGQSPATTLLNSIFTGGASPQVAAAAFGGSTVIIKSLGYNLSSDNGGGFLTAIGDRTNSNPLLGPLTLSAGNTRTHIPLVGSAAYDAGSCALSIVYQDQRGFARPHDFPGIVNAVDGCDIGAVEWTDANGDGFEDGVVVWASGFE